MDLTWVSDQRGWALAVAPCAGGLCPRLATTGDGGRSWLALPIPPGLTRNGQIDVSFIRFATATVGYLFGPALYQTDDGGRSWWRVPSPPVEALEPSAGTVIRVVYDHGVCPGPCTRMVQEAAAGSDSWHTLLRIPPPSANDGGTAQLVRQGTSVIYLPVYGNLARGAEAAHAVIFRSADGGTTWRLSDPCGGSGQNAHDAVGLAAVPGGFLAALCLSPNGTSATFVRTSADYGSSWTRHARCPAGPVTT